MANGKHRSPRGRDNDGGRRSVANENRLKALGEAVDRRNGVPARRPSRGRPRSYKRIALITLAIVVLAGLGLVGGGYLYGNWRFGQIPKINVAGEIKPISGAPFNILLIGSDSRQGLTGQVAAQTGASTGQAAGQRSDVVKIVHIDPNAGTISMLSIPRDTMVTLLANQNLYGNFNRINVNFGNGPSLVAQTITANFGIPIANTIVVSFSGMINAADAIGGVYLKFPYPAFDPYSGLNVPHPGCQLITGFQALALTRSRHYYYEPHGTAPWPKGGRNMSDSELLAHGWYYDGTSDFGRIDRQNAFLRGMVQRAKHLYNPLTINSFLSKLPQGVTLDNNFSFSELLGLAARFHGINPDTIRTYTMPVVSGVNPNIGDVLYVDQPSAQQLLVNIFGSGLQAPTNPPPNTKLQTPMPPVITPTTTTSTSTTVHAKSGKKHASTTTTTNPTLYSEPFDPTPCTP